MEAAAAWQHHGSNLQHGSSSMMGSKILEKKNLMSLPFLAATGSSSMEAAAAW